MLFLREVHYVLRHETCKMAFVVEHGVEVADLHVYLDGFDALPGALPGVELLANILEVCCVRYDERGERGTWHTENDCPWRRRRR